MHRRRGVTNSGRRLYALEVHARDTLDLLGVFLLLLLLLHRVILPLLLLRMDGIELGVVLIQVRISNKLAPSQPLASPLQAIPYRAPYLSPPPLAR